MSLRPLPAAGLSPSAIPRPAKILDVVEELAGTVTLAIDAPGAFRPGQFNMLYAFGVGEVPISCSGDPARPEVLVHTIRAVGAVTRMLCGLRAGACLGVRGPFGSAWPLEEARGHDVVLVAGGLGIAPLRPALLHMLAHRADYGRVVLLYGTRTPQDFLFAADRTAWASRADMELLLTVDHAGAGWTGPVGVVPALLPGLRLDPARTRAFLCGPEVMMRFTARELERLGVAPGGIYVSLERNMKCAEGLCGHCQFGPHFVCKDGPVFRYERVERLLTVREL